MNISIICFIVIPLIIWVFFLWGTWYIGEDVDLGVVLLTFIASFIPVGNLIVFCSLLFEVSEVGPKIKGRKL